MTERLADDGISASNVTFSRSSDLRYVGQGYELKVPFPDGIIDAAGLAEVWTTFHKVHAAEYGHSFEASPIEVVNLRVTAIGSHSKLEKLPARSSGSLDDALLYTRDSIFREDGALKTFETSVYRRDALPVGTTFDGPAILLQKDSTTVVPPGATAQVDPSGSLIITLEGRT